jgi:undecaprenyl-diphosphatase
LEASYPSSTTLLVLSVMPTLVLQANRRVKRPLAKRAIAILSMVFSAAMVWGRLLSGVHWLTDILGSLLLSAGLFSLYRAGVLLGCDKTH